MAGVPRGAGVRAGGAGVVAVRGDARAVHRVRRAADRRGDEYRVRRGRGGHRRRRGEGRQLDAAVADPEDRAEPGAVAETGRCGEHAPDQARSRPAVAGAARPGRRLEPGGHGADHGAAGQGRAQRQLVSSTAVPNPPQRRTR